MDYPIAVAYQTTDAFFGETTAVLLLGQEPGTQLPVAFGDDALDAWDMFIRLDAAGGVNLAETTSAWRNAIS